MNIPAVSIYKLSVQQMTCYHVSRRHFTKLRDLASAAFCRILATFREPAAILRVDGTWDLTLDRDTLIRGSASGIADSSAFVYGCCVFEKSSSVSAVSTIVPRYITTTRSEMYFTTLKSWAIKRYVNPIVS